MTVEHHQHRREMYKQSNKAAIDFGKMILRGAFLLNGASVTALLSTGQQKFYAAALTFGWGAAWAVVATIAAYLHQMLIAETWRNDDGSAYIPYFKGYRLSWERVEYLRLVPAFFVALSCIQFYRGASAISCLIK